MSVNLTELLEETIYIAIEDGVIEKNAFIDHIIDYIPRELLLELKLLLTGSDDHDDDDNIDEYGFLEDIYDDRFPNHEEDDDDEYSKHDGSSCLVCDRKENIKLTKHHVFPKDQHERLNKDGFTKKELSTVIIVCNMCHRTIHRLFSNKELADSYYTVDLLLENESFFRYQNWASKTRKSKRVYSKK